MIDFVAGFLSAWILCSLLQRKLSRRGGNIGATPLIRNEGRTTAQRIYRGAMWREKGSDIWYPLGNEPDAAEFARQSVTVQGLNWPATLGDFTLVGPADNQGAWRWYERQHNGTTERVRVDHQLMPLGPSSVGYSPHSQGGATTPPPREPVTRWRILALTLGEKAHPDPRIADRVALVRLAILLSYLGTNVMICAGVIRHWG